MKYERCLQDKKLERTLVLGFEHNLCLDCKEEIIIPKPNKDKRNWNNINDSIDSNCHLDYFNYS
jgi:hypothetical protein